MITILDGQLMSNILQIVSLITILTINCFIPTKLLAQDCGAICNIDYWSEIDAESDTILQVLEALPSVDARHKYGWTVLSVAASFGHVEAVRILLEQGADPNIADDWGSTAVFAAVQAGSLDIVKMLVEEGANINHQNLKGKDAYSKALLRDEIEIANFLKNFLKVESETVTSNTAKKTTHLPVGQPEMALASDEDSPRLRFEIKKLEARNSELSKNLQILKTEVKNLESVIAVEREEQETESQKELKKLRTEITNLREEIAAYKTPLVPLIKEINSKISEENFLGAYTKILSLRKFPLYESEVNNVFIETALKAVKPIPAVEHRRNLEAYKFLLKLAPDNVKHIEKVNYYEQKISDANEKKKIDEIVGIISVSDDLAKYRSKMAKAALELIKSGKCTRSQIKYYGGWVRSGKRSGQYFMDCGKQRVWFNPKSPNTVYADRAISKNKASEMCKNAITKQALNQPDFHYFDTSYTVHNPRKAVTYVQGFDVKNAFGAKMKYRAYCLIQPSGDLDLSLMNK